MKNILISLILVITLLSPITIHILCVEIVILKVVNANKHNIVADSDIDTINNIIDEVQDVTYELNKINQMIDDIELDLTIDLNEHITFKIPTKTFSLIESSSSSDKKTLKYKDNKAEITISYIKGIKENKNIPEFMLNEVANIKTITYNNYDETLSNGEWEVVQPQDLINNCYVKVYYMVDESEGIALWVREDINKEAFHSVDDEDYSDFESAEYLVNFRKIRESIKLNID